MDHHLSLWRMGSGVRRTAKCRDLRDGALGALEGKAEIPYKDCGRCWTLGDQEPSRATAPCSPSDNQGCRSSRRRDSPIESGGDR